jgi:hypothetical protein
VFELLQHGGVNLQILKPLSTYLASIEVFLEVREQLKPVAETITLFSFTRMTRHSIACQRTSTGGLAMPMFHFSTV